MKLKLLLIFVALNSVLLSQTDSLPVVKPESYFRLNYDNDLFSQTDRYYTQGIIVSFINPIVKYSPFSKTLIKLKGAVNYYGLHVEQDCFTPKSIRVDTISFGERPYTGTIFISHSLNSLSKRKKMLLQTQLDLGGIGNCSSCEDEQKAIHRALVDAQPLGWQYQLKNDVIINYRAKIEKGIIYTNFFEVMANANLRVGTLYNDISAGLNIRLGLFDPYFNNLGLSKDANGRKFKIYAVAKVNEKAVGYNATLQGGLFTNSIYVLQANVISRFVFDAYAGIVVAYKRFSLEFDKTYISKEYNTGLEHGWGRCVITAAF